MANKQSNVTANEIPMLPPKDSDAIQTNEKEEQSVNSNTKNDAGKHIFLILCIVGVILGIGFEIFNEQNRSNVPVSIANKTLPKYWVLSKTNLGESLLKHLHLVLGRIGYEKTTNETPWDLLWSHPYPFTILKPHLNKLKPHQRINHFPGTGFITSKVDFATTESKYIPKAFRLPKDKENFLKYASENRKAVFVEKNNQHRGVVLKNVTEMNTTGDKFVQEYMPNPFLVDGYKFDIGVYVVVTSVDPLRVYYYNGDVLFRYCPDKYYPFDPLNVRKYVVEDDYRPTWKIPALAHSHTELGFSMKDSFDIYVRSKGKDPDKMWREVQKAMGEIFLQREKHIVEALKNYPSKSHFFELLRVDLIVDEDLNVYLLEVNMSPNLSSPNPTNQLLYEQVLYSLFSVVGLVDPVRNYLSDVTKQNCGTKTTNEHHAACMENNAAAAMLSADKNIAVWGDECSSCTDCDGLCTLCLNCLPSNMRLYLLQAYREHLHRGDFRRLFPPAMIPHSADEGLDQLTPMNQLMSLWYQGKCNLDAAWCT